MNPMNWAWRHSRSRAAWSAVRSSWSTSWGSTRCPLCLMQRLWTILGGAVVLAGLALNPRTLAYPAAALACGLVGAGFAVRQLWLQSLPADQVPACGPDMAYMIDAFPLSDILKAMTMGTGNCAEVTWTMLGISIAGWALLGFVVLGATLVQWLRVSRATDAVAV